MRYSYEFKLMCIEMYRRGRWPKTPDGVSTKTFRDTILKWNRIEMHNGPDALKHTTTNKVWPPELKYELVAEVLSGKSIRTTAFEAGINNGILYQWVRKYKEFGYNGLVNKKKGRKSSKPDMSNKSIKPKPLTESEREELIRLRVENEAIKAEIEAVKKRIALRHKRWEAAQLKAKKQQSSKNSEKKDTN